jgi:hypothetical protein
MPIKHRLQRTAPASAAELTRMLMNEWSKPKKEGQPVIVLEGGKGQPQHIYVIWDQWQALDQTQRSEIIMDVVEHLGGKHAIPDLSLVTVAMGLTSEEAKRMGIEAA